MKKSFIPEIGVGFLPYKKKTIIIIIIIIIKNC